MTVSEIDIFPAKISGKFEVHGLEVNARYWFERMNDSPDVVFTLLDSSVFINSDDEGYAYCSFTIHGKQMTPQKAPEMVDVKQVKTDDDEIVYIMGEQFNKMSLLSDDAVEKTGNKIQAGSTSQASYTAVAASASASAATTTTACSPASLDFDTVTGTTTDIGVEAAELIADFGVPEFKSLEEIGSDFSSAITIDNLPKRKKAKAEILKEGEQILQDHFEDSIQVTNSAKRNSTSTSGAKCSQIEPQFMKINEPASESITFSDYCYQGSMKLYFDADSRIYKAEFELFG